jgi:hypothetical protein
MGSKKPSKNVSSRETVTGVAKGSVRVLGDTPLGKNRSLYPFTKLIAIPPFMFFCKTT